MPEWSLYDDGEIVWVDDEGRPTPGFARQVWIGRLRDDAIRQLLTFVEQMGFWNLDNHYQPSPQVSTDTKAVTLDAHAMPDQLSSTLTVRRKARQKQVTVYPADWPGAPDAYRVLRDRLLQTRPPEAREFQPQNFRLMVRAVASNTQNVEMPWPFPNIDVARAQPDGLRLNRDDGLAVAEFLRNSPAVVVLSGHSFSVQLFADPPR